MSASSASSGPVSASYDKHVRINDQGKTLMGKAYDYLSNRFTDDISDVFNSGLNTLQSLAQGAWDWIPSATEQEALGSLQATNKYNYDKVLRHKLAEARLRGQNYGVGVTGREAGQAYNDYLNNTQANRANTLLDAFNRSRDIAANAAGSAATSADPLSSAINMLSGLIGLDREEYGTTPVTESSRVAGGLKN